MNKAISCKQYPHLNATPASWVRALIFILFASLFLTSPAMAASACKGKSKTVCGAASSCSWVDSYKTKKGTKVKAFCRAKPGKGKKATKSKTKSTATSSSTAKTSSSKKSSTKKKATAKGESAKKSGKQSKKKAKKKSTKKKDSKKKVKKKKSTSS